MTVDGDVRAPVENEVHPRAVVTLRDHLDARSDLDGRAPRDHLVDQVVGQLAEELYGAERILETHESPSCPPG